MYCSKCGMEIPTGTRVCANCGTVQGETKFCQHCGALIDKNSTICPKCGQQVGQVQLTQAPAAIVNPNPYGGPGYVKPPKDKWVAFLLCFFLGGFGAHKFYEDKVAMGILYIFTGGLCGIGWLVDLIIILTRPNYYYP